MGTPEHAPVRAERGIEASDAARERHAELLRSPEKSVEASPVRQAEKLESARRDAAESAVSHERPGHEGAAQAPATHHVRPANGRAARHKAYKDILHHTQRELPPVSRAFSKVIHNPVVERVSSAIGTTVARPNAVLFGALFAFLVSAAVYVVAKRYGYALSGFEAIGSFVIGWTVGILIDVARVALRRR